MVRIVTLGIKITLLLTLISCASFNGERNKILFEKELNPEDTYVTLRYELANASHQAKRFGLEVFKDWAVSAKKSNKFADVKHHLFFNDKEIMHEKKGDRVFKNEVDIYIKHNVEGAERFSFRRYVPIITLGLIPVKSDSVYEVHVKYKTSKGSGDFIVHEKVTTWSHLFLLPFSLFYFPDTVESNVRRNMFERTLSKIP